MATLDLGTSDPVTASLIWALTMLASNFFSIIYADSTEKIIICGKGGWLLQHLQSQAALNLPELSGTA